MKKSCREIVAKIGVALFVGILAGVCAEIHVQIIEYYNPTVDWRYQYVISGFTLGVVLYMRRNKD